MGKKSRLKRERRHRTTMLKEVIGTDLLTWKEKLIQGETSGLYSLTNEQAYCKSSEDQSSMTVTEFERKLQKDIDPNFRVVFNANTSSSEHIIQGHSIYFYIEPWDSYIKVMNVGKNADNIIPAESVGRVVQYRGESYRNSGLMDEEAILYRGWVAAYEGCKFAYERWETEGISPAMTISPGEIFKLSEAFQVVGFKEKLEEAKVNMDNILEAVAIQEAEEELKQEAIAEEKEHALQSGTVETADSSGNTGGN